MVAIAPHIHAPTIDRVELVLENEALAMARDEAGWWRCSEERAWRPGERYRFRLNSRSWFSEGETVEVVDPEARQVDHEARWALTTDMWHHDWRHDDHPLPSADQQVIYECFVAEFPGGDGKGRFVDVIERLPYLRDLGITALELLPVERGPLGQGWGYTPAHCFAVEPRFGDDHDLAALIDAAHGEGMAVILDIVLNHAHDSCPLTSIDHNCWFHRQPKDPERSWGPQFDYEHQLPDGGIRPAREFALRRLRHWLEDFHVDGFRFDAVAQVENDDALGEWRALVHEVAGDKPCACIAECVPERPGLVGPGGRMDRTWHEHFCQVLRATMRGEWDGEGLEAAVDCRRDGYVGSLDVVNFIANHDQGHTLHHLRGAGLDEGEALHRMELGYTLLLTAVGIPMLWMGDEYGAGDPGDQDDHPLPWVLLERDERRQALHARVRRLIALRHEHAALRGGKIDILERDDERRLLAYHRWDDSGARLLVVLHPGDDARSLSLAAPACGNWHEVMLDYQVATDDDARLTLELAPWGAQVLVHQG